MAPWDDDDFEYEPGWIDVACIIALAIIFGWIAYYA